MKEFCWALCAGWPATSLSRAVCHCMKPSLLQLHCSSQYESVTAKPCQKTRFVNKTGANIWLFHHNALRLHKLQACCCWQWTEQLPACYAVCSGQWGRQDSCTNYRSPCPDTQSCAKETVVTAADGGTWTKYINFRWSSVGGFWIVFHFAGPWREVHLEEQCLW